MQESQHIMASHVLKIGHLTDTKDFYFLKWEVHLFWFIADGVWERRYCPLVNAPLQMLSHLLLVLYLHDTLYAWYV